MPDREKVALVSHGIAAGNRGQSPVELAVLDTPVACDRHLAIGDAYGACPGLAERALAPASDPFLANCIRRVGGHEHGIVSNHTKQARAITGTHGYHECLVPFVDRHPVRG